MIVLATRPGMGKTAFVLSMARNMAVDHQIPVAIFSLEMSAVAARPAFDLVRNGNQQRQVSEGQP